jgi:thioredoxin reductase (NADPH)
LALARAPARHRVASVTLCHRGAALSRARPASRTALDAAVQSGLVTVLLDARLDSIGSDHIHIDHRGAPRALRNDAVIICAGGTLPTALLTDIGVAVETKYGTA